MVLSGGDGRLVDWTGIAAAADERERLAGAGIGALPAGGSGLRIFVLSFGSA
jgi:hypothetical protein